MRLHWEITKKTPRGPAGISNDQRRPSVSEATPAIQLPWLYLPYLPLPVLVETVKVKTDGLYFPTKDLCSMALSYWKKMSSFKNSYPSIYQEKFVFVLTLSRTPWLGFSVFHICTFTPASCKKNLPLYMRFFLHDKEQKQIFPMSLRQVTIVSLSLDCLTLN